jgi:hypothetical protein
MFKTLNYNFEKWCKNTTCSSSFFSTQIIEEPNGEEEKEIKMNDYSFNFNLETKKKIWNYFHEKTEQLLVY